MSLTDFVSRARRAYYASPLYRRALAASPPDRVVMTPPEPWPGDAKRGAALLRGQFLAAGDAAPLDGAAWRRTDISAAWLTELHGFDWLADLQATGGDAARRRARLLILDWIAQNPPCRGPGWLPDALGRRLASWLTRFEFFGASAEDADRDAILASLGQQAVHLALVAPDAPPGLAALRAAKGLVYAGLALPAADDRRDQGLRLFARALAAQLHDDGGHVSRNPSNQLLLLRYLVDVRATLVAADAEVPDFIPDAIDRVARVVRFFRHGDGALALFNGSNAEADWYVDAVLTRSGVRGRPASAAPASGFQRVAAGRALVLVDAGDPPPPGHDETAHAGTLSFEISVGRDRLVVNCGAYPGGDGSWRRVARATAAHSTVVVRNTNSSGLEEAGGLSRRPGRVTARREEADGAVLLDLSHDGYVPGFGLTHRRRLYVSAAGEDIRGEDHLSGEGWHDFAVRFHLHPSVRASQVQDGGAVLLRLGGGDGWRFAVAGGRAEIQPSVYMGERGRVQRAEQIVVAGSTEATDLAVVKWTFKRVPRR